MAKKFNNPFRPGAGHQPPYLAGRGKETNEFKKLLEQDVILENLILTGLRGVGKTVLLDQFKPIAQKSGWLWVGTDLSESATLSEDHIATRLLADMAVATSSITVGVSQKKAIGFLQQMEDVKLDFHLMHRIYAETPGLVSDRLKAVLRFVWECLEGKQIKGIIFAYDEAQNMTDHAGKDQYPLSLMLDCFQSIQKQNIPFMLVLAGLPTLFPKLVEARTFAERMFRVLFLDRLTREDSRDAILKPLNDANCPVKITDDGINSIYEASGGYPYFIQFICRETYDSYLQQLGAGSDEPQVYMTDITRKLDSDFFAGRWAKPTDRQRELLTVIAQLDHCDGEFTLHEVAEKSREILSRPFSPSQISQMFVALAIVGLIYKNRHGKYAFAVPLLGPFIIRQNELYH
jgi:hypothetical protein